MIEPTERPEWRKSCASNTCIEVAKVADRVLIRDSKYPERAPLSFSETEWDAFVRGIKEGVFEF